jgi:hypothetical protein
MISLDKQIAEVKREIALRKSVYPGLIMRRRMRQGEADEHIARMEAVQRTLEWLAEHEDEIKAALSKENAAP